MFLDATRQRNPGLVDAAARLHADGQIEADTYVIDADTVEENAAALARTAAAHGVEAWFVVKQIGRNPVLAERIARHLPRAAAIDLREARRLHSAGVALGNVGHLVQIPVRALDEVLAWSPDHVTVYDRANLGAVAEAARRAGRVQDVLLRIAGGTVYPAQEGGFSVDEVDDVLDHTAGLMSIRVVGVTGFPCALFDEAAGTVRTTDTAERVIAAAEHLRDRGISPVISMPSHSSCSTIPMLAARGATHVEPGHALTGTTPEHAVRDGLPERPAVVYVSEIARTQPEHAVFGGGFYARGHADHALIDPTGRQVRARLIETPAENIDYYRRLELPGAGADGHVRLGDTVVMAFRTQIFDTRSRVAVVSSVDRQPRLEGVFDSVGTRIEVGQ